MSTVRHSELAFVSPPAIVDSAWYTPAIGCVGVGMRKSISRRRIRTEPSANRKLQIPGWSLRKPLVRLAVLDAPTIAELKQKLASRGIVEQVFVDDTIQ